jgi:hypothetical protein
VSVADCEDQIQRTKYALEDAERHDADADAERLKAELKRLRIELNEVRDRTTQRNNTGMMVGGIILSSVGGAGILVALGAGAALSISGGRDNGAGTVAILGLVGGLACGAVGIPLAVIGGKRVPKDPSSAEARPILLVGPEGAAVRVRF